MTDLFPTCEHGSRCGEPDCASCSLTPAQRAVVESLVSEFDDLHVVADLEGCDDPAKFDGWWVFEGQGADGPVLGYLKPDASVSWLTA